MFPFLQTYSELENELDNLNLAPELRPPFSDDLSILAKPLTFGSKGQYHLPNRFMVQPMEGFDSGADGEPLELGFRRYQRFASGGAGLIWFEATAVRWNARSNEQQFWLNEKSADAFAKLLDETRNTARQAFGHEMIAVIQLTHSGRYSKPTRGKRQPVIAQHSGVLDAAHNIPADHPLITDAELDALQDDYIVAAKLAARCGFDGVDVKSCHGYLLNELLGARTRDGKYGGSFENRTRFLRDVVARVKNEVPDIFVTSRLNVYDAVKYPWGFGVNQENYKMHDLSEPLQLVTILKGLGVPLLNATIGNPYFNPHYNRPYIKPAKGTVAYDEHPLLGVARFINIVKTVQLAQPELPIIGAGTGYLRHLVPKVAAGIIQNGYASLFGQGRCSFAYPDAPKDILTKGEMDPKKTCMVCSGCTNFMRAEQPTGCCIRDREFYRQ
jgi:2,4-dienoyl-CoA reductase-like NADH-dependent reductase (Old Yellow Enzyme family)